MTLSNQLSDVKDKNREWFYTLTIVCFIMVSFLFSVSIKIINTYILLLLWFKLILLHQITWNILNTFPNSFFRKTTPTPCQQTTQRQQIFG